MSRPTEYTPEEDALIARMVEAGEPMKAILAQMLHRTEQSVWARLKRLRYYGVVGRRPERARPIKRDSETSAWTRQKDACLAELWGTTLSTAAIGEAMGITKNAVIGRVRRLALPGRPSPIKRNGVPKASPVPRVRATLPPLPSVHPAVVKARRQDDRARNKAGIAGGSHNLLDSVEFADVEDLRAIRRAVWQVPRTASPPPPRGTCCWLDGERGAYRQCDAVAVRGSYCAEHGRRAYQPSQTNKETSHAV